MALKLNPITGRLDLVTDDINQLQIGDADTYFKWVAPDTLELYVNGALRQSWTTAVVAPPTLGSPYGLLLTLTQPA